MSNFEDVLRIGIIQTTLNNDTAWYQYGKLQSHMNSDAESMVMEEIRRGFNDFYARATATPRIVLIPEYSIPHSGLKRIERFAKVIDSVVIGGCDLFVEENSAKNKGVIVIPNSWPKIEPAVSNTKKHFGKAFFSRTELKWFSSLDLKPAPENTNYIIDAGVYGNIGIAICADFYDIERFVIYKGRIHHLIIIAYNKDNKSFDFLAEAISRLLMCNVVVCNTGHYGDSLAFSPYSEEHRRIIYKNSGAGLFASQVIELPVRNLNKEQIRADRLFQNYPIMLDGKKPEFKWAPGYKKH